MPKCSIRLSINKHFPEATKDFVVYPVIFVRMHYVADSNHSTFHNAEDNAINTLAPISPNSRAHSPIKYQTPPCLTLVLWKYQVFCEIQSSAITYGITRVHRNFKFIKEKLSEHCIKSVMKNTVVDYPLFSSGHKLHPP